MAGPLVEIQGLNFRIMSEMFNLQRDSIVQWFSQTS